MIGHGFAVLVLVGTGISTRSAVADDRTITAKEAMVKPSPVPAAASAAIPPGGIYFASHSSHGSSQVDDHFFIAKLEPTGLREVYRETDDGRGHGGMVWADATTLITIDSGTTSAGHVGLASKLTMAATGAPSIAPIELRKDDFGLQRGDAIDDLPDFDLVVTATNEVWIGVCVRQRNDKCRRSRFLRIHGGDRKSTDRRPRNVVGRVNLGASNLDHGFPVEMHPAVPAPKGVAVKLVKPARGQRSGGFICKSSTSTHVSPRDDKERDSAFPARPEKIRWVFADPPIFAVTGEMDVPTVSGKDRYLEFFRGCGDMVHGFRAIRPRIWLEEISVDHDKAIGGAHDEIRISVDGTAVGTIAGSSYEIVIAP